MTKIEKISEYIFYFFLFILPFQGRKVFLTDFSFYSGDFTEYTTAFLYLSDIALLLSASFLFLYFISNKKDCLVHKIEKRQKLVVSMLLAMTLWMSISTAINNQYFEISLFKTLKMAELSLLAFLIFYFFKNYKKLIYGLYIIIFSATIQSLIGIYQFISQKSFFQNTILHKISGETILNPEASGIAKIAMDGEKLVRSYGTFPHPNILGGFLVFSIMISMFIYLEHRYYILSNIYKYFEIKSYKCQAIITYLFWTFTFTTQLLALLTSFSRSAWIAFIISMSFFISLKTKKVKIVSRETISKLKQNTEFLSSLIIILTIILANTEFILNRIPQDINTIPTNQANNISNDTFGDRILYNNVSRETFQKKPIAGSGPGTFIFQIDKINNPESWQYQPAHNIYFLILSEIGIIGLMLFLWIIKISIKRLYKQIVSRETIKLQKDFEMTILSITIGFLFIAFFDHYFYTLQQGQLLFWFLISLSLIKCDKIVSRETI